jgi:hypothetical protein
MGAGQDEIHDPTLRFSLEPSQEFLITVELRYVLDNVNRSIGTEGAAHLKNRDTSPRSKRAALLTFVSNGLVLLTRASAALSGSSVTIVRTGSQT